MGISDYKDGIASLVEATDAILRGDFEHETTAIDAEGLISTLAQKINKMIVNLKTVQSSLTSAGDHTPSAVDTAQNVVELMAQSTGEVLNKSDKISALADDLEKHLSISQDDHPAIVKPAQDKLSTLKAAVFDIIASQSYQDVARQKMESLIGELNNIRDWLIEALVILNIKKDKSPENVQKKTELLREVSESKSSESLKQDLVDDLLAEFGF